MADCANRIFRFSLQLFEISCFLQVCFAANRNLQDIGRRAILQHMKPAKLKGALWLHIIVCCGLLLSLCGCSADDPTRSNTFVPLTSIEVTGTYTSMAAQTVNQYRATGDFSGAFTRDITDEVAWRIENKKIASVSSDTGSEGLVTALLAGETTVVAIYADISGSAPVLVSTAFLTGITVTPEDLELQIGVTQQYEALGTFSDGTNQDITTLVAWESSDQEVAIIDDAGLAETVAAGVTTISATWQEIESRASLLVNAAQLSSINLKQDDETVDEATIAQGTDIQFAAEGTFSDDTTDDVSNIVAWESSDTSVATITELGLASGVKPGEAEITVSYEVDNETISATVTLTVTNAVIEAISITPGNTTIQEDEDQQFAATGTFSDDSEQDITDLATWSVTNSSVGTINNSSGSRGLFVPIEKGFTIIEATFDGVTGETGLTVE